MATLAHSHHRSLGRIVADSAQSLRARIAVQLEVVRQRRRIARELNTYSDAELAELGFSRFDIPAVAAGTYRR